jgi:hypothetical protein
MPPRVACPSCSSREGHKKSRTSRDRSGPTKHRNINKMHKHVTTMVAYLYLVNQLGEGSQTRSYGEITPDIHMVMTIFP